VNLAEESSRVNVTTFSVDVGEGLYLTLELVNIDLMSLQSAIVVLKALKNFLDSLIVVIHTVSVLLGLVFHGSILFFEEFDSADNGIDRGFLSIALVKFSNFKACGGVSSGGRH